MVDERDLDGRCVLERGVAQALVGAPLRARDDGRHAGRGRRGRRRRCLLLAVGGGRAGVHQGHPQAGRGEPGRGLDLHLDAVGVRGDQRLGGTLDVRGLRGAGVRPGICHAQGVPRRPHAVRAGPDLDAGGVRGRVPGEPDQAVRPDGLLGGEDGQPPGAGRARGGSGRQAQRLGGCPVDPGGTQRHVLERRCDGVRGRRRRRHDRQEHHRGHGERRQDQQGQRSLAHVQSPRRPCGHSSVRGRSVEPSASAARAVTAGPQ